MVDESDLFRKGEVASFYPKQRSGAVRTEQGGLVPFLLDQINVMGDAQHLEARARVGFDLSRTSHGYRVTKIKIY